jgi:hypothetical protein
MVAMVAGLCKVLARVLADTPETLVDTVYDTTTPPASSRRCRRTIDATLRVVTVLPGVSTASNAVLKTTLNCGESSTPEMVCVTLMVTTVAAAVVEGMIGDSE